MTSVRLGSSFRNCNSIVSRRHEIGRRRVKNSSGASSERGPEVVRDQPAQSAVNVGVILEGERFIRAFDERLYESCGSSVFYVSY